MMMVMVMVMVTTAAAMLIVLVVVMVVLLMVTAAAAMLLMSMVMCLCQSLHMCCQAILACHSLQDLLTSQLMPGSGDQSSGGIMLTDQLHSSIQLCLGNIISTGQNNGTGSFDLVVVELTKVLHIHLHLAGICHSHSVAQHHILIDHLFYSGHNIAELTHTGGLDHDTVRMILLNYLIQRLAKIAYQAAANAAGVHFGNIHTGILQETAVNTDLAEFIFNQNQLLTLVSFLDHLFDQCGLTSTQKAGINIDLSHRKTFLLVFFAIIPPNNIGCKKKFPKNTCILPKDIIY